MNSNILNVLMDIKKYAKQKLKIGKMDTKLIGQ